MEKAKLEDDLAKKLARRPDPTELIKEHILNCMIFSRFANGIVDEDPTKEPKE